MPEQANVDLLSLLEDERKALKTGNFDALAPILETKVAMFDKILSDPTERHTLENIQVKLEANQALLAAAISGVSNARTRITALKSVSEGLSTYNRSGELSNMPTRAPEIEKKA